MGKRFGSNEEVISENEAYFEAKDKFFFTNGMKLLEKHWNQCIAREGDYVDEFCLKVVILLVRSGTYWVMCLSANILSDPIFFTLTKESWIIMRYDLEFNIA